MVAALVGATLVLGAPAAPAQVPTSFERLDGYAAAGTPAKYNKVGVLKFGPRTARNVLILNPGTSASAAYFAPLARDVASRADGWQVWAVERRENLLEDHSVLNRAKDGRATNRQLFDYYLGWVSDPSVTNHFDLIPDARVAIREALGHAGRDRGSAPGREGGASARRQDRHGRPFARRHDHLGLRHVGLRGPARRP